MWNLKACAVCLTTDLKLNDISDGQIRREFNLASGLKTAQCNGMPQYLCVYCTAYVKRFVKFREKCHLAYYTLKEILDKSQEIKPYHLQSLNRDLLGLKPTLSFMDLKNCHQEEVMFQWVKYNRLNVSQKINIPILQSSTIEDNMKFAAKENQNNINKDLVFEVPAINPECIKEESNDLISDTCFDVSSKDKSQNDAFVEQGNLDDTENYFDNYISDNEFDNTDELCKEKKEDQADGSNLEEEYANMIPISMNEAKAVSEVYKLFSNGKFRCQYCNKGYTSKNRLDVHLRMHDKHVSGSYLCELCNYYYKTEFLLKTHMTEKHMYKYLCRKCSEVSYDRVSAKQHFIWSHLQKGKKKNANWYETRPSWLNTRGGKRVKGIVSLKPVRKISKLPDDFPLYSPISQEEQYLLINERKKTSNYLDSQYKCELCYRGFREMDTYNKHMRKHDPALSGPVQCDMCKLQFRDARRIYKHMNITHLFKYTCQQCGYVCYNKGQARLHYRWHNNVTYPCPHCKREFKKMSTRLTHIRIKHPSNFICNICGHSFVSENGLYCHKNLTHTKEEIECSAALTAEANPEADPLYCAECRVRFSCELAFDTHLGSSNKHAETNLSTKPRKSVTSIDAQRRRPGRGRPRRLRGASEVLNNGVATSSNCELCGKHLANDVQARRHYQTTHPGAEFPKRYMCDVCGHTTKQYANLMVHMRTHTREKPYSCPHCDRRFSMPSNRDRHLVVHTGEKRYQCQHCNRRFTQSSAVKLHIQTVHLKIPYAPWDKKNRKRRRELDTPVAPLPPDASAPFPVQPKLVFDSTVDYLNAFITYNDE